MRNDPDNCPLIVMRDDPNQLTPWLDDWSDDDCRQVQAMVDRHDAVMKPTPLTRDQACAARRMWARWQAHTTGKSFVLQVQNRTCDHTFRVHAHGKNVFQAVLRHYKGLGHNGTTIWQCTKVVAEFDCVCDRTVQAGKLLCGNPV